MKRYVTLVLFLLTLAVPVLAQTPAPPQTQPAPSKPAAQDEFVPVNAPMNPQDTIPAPRLVAIAYGFIWVVLFGYLWSVRRRRLTVSISRSTVDSRLRTDHR